MAMAMATIGSIVDAQSIGNFTTTEIEAAFGLEPGSIHVPGTAMHDHLAETSSFTTHHGIPLLFSRMDRPAPTERNAEVEQLLTFGGFMVHLSPTAIRELLAVLCY